jgi:hypothetical protein
MHGELREILTGKGMLEETDGVWSDLVGPEGRHIGVVMRTMVDRACVLWTALEPEDLPRLAVQDVGMGSSRRIEQELLTLGARLALQGLVTGSEGDPGA